ncbi:MAG: ATP-binding protein [Gammaproteobacteria bacterium]|nr:ATP-binding protein [Gammaproteobacteria bacterium]
MTDSNIDSATLKEFHRIIMNNTAMWLNALDNNARVVMWNRAAERISGYRKEEVLGKENIWELLYPDEAYRNFVFARALEIIEQGKEIEDFETTIQCKDGSHRVLSWNSHNLTDSQGEVTGSLALARDVTDIRNSEEKLERALERAEAGSKAKDQFIAATSHEIRTPFTAIMGMLDMLSKTELSEQQKEYLGVARAATNILHTTVEDILDVARLVNGQYSLQQSAGDLIFLLENTANVLRCDAGKKGLEFRLEKGENLPEIIITDHSRLQQVLINLGYNAIKFTSAGHITLHVQLLQERPATLRFMVSDTGMGIPAEKIETIFQPYEQADNSITREYGGLGLGLSIVSQLVELMAGRIEVSSIVGEGTTFTIELPFTEGISEPKEDSENSLKVVPQGAQRVLRILLTDDNNLNVFVIKSFLKDFPHTIDVAGNGRQALEQYQGAHYDLVLMDIQMPEMDGHTAMRQIRKFEASTGRSKSYITALTGHATAEEKTKALQDGFDEYITKPIDITLLLAMVERVSSL